MCITLVKIEGESQLYRDTSSLAVVVGSADGAEAYKARKQKRLEELKKIHENESIIKELKNDIDSLKELVLQLTKHLEK